MLSAKLLYRTRKDPFVKHWDEIESMLESAPELQATTILAYLTEKYHGNYNGKQLRCLQKRLKQWRAAHGKDKTVIFLQNILPFLANRVSLIGPI
ncbi:hypothetical protein [Rickettsia endosymbiont of Urophora cardui]|uniref:hypothetical protein n=1 Tax=Rickettsia endosymbiont of Urophora cardui TaxID=3066265 RepID=UPI00313A7D7D